MEFIRKYQDIESCEELCQWLHYFYILTWWDSYEWDKKVSLFVKTLGFDPIHWLFRLYFGLWWGRFFREVGSVLIQIKFYIFLFLFLWYIWWTELTENGFFLWLIIFYIELKLFVFDVGSLDINLFLRQNFGNVKVVKRSNNRHRRFLVGFEPIQL